MVGVLEFFSDKQIPSDEELLNLFTHIGTQLGRVYERELSKTNLKNSEAQIRSIVESAYDAFVLMNDQGLIVDWNAQAEKIFGWTKEEAIGRRLSETIIPNHLRSAHEKGHQDLKKTGIGPVLNKRLELPAVNKEGTTFPVEITISQIQGIEGTLYSAFLHDISERKKQEEELKQAKEKAEISEKAKQQFLANMSHEIRTPMNAILGFSKILQSTSLNADQKEALNLIIHSGENLLVIINDILDLTKIEAGKLDLEELPINISELVSSSVSILKEKAVEKKIAIDCYTDDNIPPSLIGDPVRIGQILLNLISNAVKFTYKGKVLVQASLLNQNEKSANVYFSVSDTGVGIPADRLPHIFESFTQAAQDINRRFGGTGLGLTIAKELVGKYGGQIEVKSTQNVGSTFAFNLQLQKSKDPTIEFPLLNAAKQEKNKGNLKQNLRILVAEDNPINQLLIKKILNTWHINFDIANNGNETIEKLKQVHYHLILMDVQMPEMDGYEATRFIREQLQLVDIPIIAMTAHAIIGEKEKCQRAGMNDYISKPFYPDELYNKILAYT